MNIRRTYKTLLWTGLLLFIAGVIGDANAIPYLRYGVTFGSILFMIGTVIWVSLRIKKPILHPYNSNDYKSTFDAFFAFMFNNFILEFWAFCCAFGMLIVIGGGTAMKSTNGFRVAIDKIRTDKQLINQIGDFKEAGILVAGSSGPTEAKLSFSAYGTKGGTKVNISVAKESGEWRVNSLKFE